VWVDDTLYVSSSGRVDAYTGFDGRAFATHRTVLTLPAGVGETNGIIGAPDGRLLLGISSPSDHTAPTSPYSAAIVSFRPDGSDLQVYAGGIRAPIGLTFYPGTSDLFVTMNQRDDLGDATPGDWLAQVQQGQAWGFPDCYGQGGAVCDGVPQPVAELDQHAAVSGVAMVTGEAGSTAGSSVGSTIGTSALVAEWSQGAVRRVALTRDGSTYAGTTHPFLTGLTNPVPLLTRPDGTVLVGDWTTGTIYLISGASAA
jgi:glucose/arabinose dehydrogenase